MAVASSRVSCLQHLPVSFTVTVTEDSLHNPVPIQSGCSNWSICAPKHKYSSNSNNNILVCIFLFACF